MRLASGSRAPFIDVADPAFSLRSAEVLLPALQYEHAASYILNTTGTGTLLPAATAP